MADIHQMLHMIDSPQSDKKVWEPRIVKTVAFATKASRIWLGRSKSIAIG